MQALLYANLTQQTLAATLDGTTFEWPNLIQGDDAVLAFRFAESLGDVNNEVSRVVSGFKASIGRVDARPTGGTLKLKIGPAATSSANTTGALNFDVTPAALQAALNLLSDLASNQVTVRADNGSLLVTFADGEQYEIEPVNNLLAPLSFVVVRPYEQDGKWVHEIRFTQAALTSTSSQARILPLAPVISEVRAGGTLDSFVWNEVQAITFSPAFRGTYQLSWAGRKTAVLDPVADGPVEVAAALNAIADEEEEFIVTIPTSNVAHIEFAGDALAGTNHDLLGITVFASYEGDVTCTLPLDRIAVSVALRGLPQITVPIEVTFTLQSVSDPEILQTHTFRDEVTILANLNRVEMETDPNVDWLKPPQPVNYVPFNPDNIVQTTQSYVVAIGNGSATVFAITHGLDTDDLIVGLRYNTSGGAGLVHGTDYTLVYNSANQLTVTIIGFVPTAGQVALIISTAGPVTAFLADIEITTGQVTGLDALLTDLGDRMEELENLVPIGALASEGATSGQVAQWTLPVIGEVYPVRTKIEVKSDIASIDLSTLPRRGGLLPAIHATLIQELPLPLPTPSSGLVGNLYQNQSGSTIDLPGAVGRRSIRLKDDEFAACDGRGWYRVKRKGATSSYYPTDFERELFAFAVNDKQLRLKKRLHLEFGLELAVLDSNTSCQLVLVIEHGSFTAASGVGGEGVNLAEVVWDEENPILAQTIIVMPVACSHVFGCAITRQLVDSVDTIAASLIRYGAEEGDASAPATANFALRARLVYFDTEDNEPDPDGFVALVGLKSNITGGESDQIGIATIK